jgi:hypothetical protein
MIRAWLPEDIETTHAMLPDQNILKAVVQCMAHVKGACNIWGWNDDGIGFRAIFFACRKNPGFFPIFVNTWLCLVGIKGLWQHVEFSNLGNGSALFLDLLASFGKAGAYFILKYGAGFREF